jgi:hypothetical protein
MESLNTLINANKCAVWKLFSGAEESKLIDYITTAINMQYDLSRKTFMELT